MRPLSELDQIDWASLDHAYGNAADVPEMLRALVSASADERARARDGLWAALDHQGVQRFESTLRAVPFLIALVADEATPERSEIVRLLAEIAVGDTCWFMHDGFHPEKQTAPDHCSRPQSMATTGGGGIISRGFPDIGEGHDMTPGHGLYEIYQAVAEGLPLYLAALDRGDEALRCAVPFVTAFLTERAAEAAPRLTRLLEDRSPLVRASAALGLSHVSKFDPEARAAALATLQQMWIQDLGELVRRAVALALVRFEQPDDTVEVRQYLREQLSAGLPAVLPHGRFPWFRMDSPPFVFCTTFIGTAAEEREPVTEAGCDALGHVSDPDDAADLAGWLLQVGVNPDEMNPLSHRVLKSVAGSQAAWHYTDIPARLDRLGLPSDREALATFLNQ